MTVKQTACAILWGLIPLLLWTGPARAGEEIRLAVPAADLSMTPVYLAHALGFFAAQGLDVDLFTTQGSSLSLRALMSRQVDAAFTPGDAAILAFQRSPEIVMVYSGFTRPIINWAMNREVAQRRGLVNGSPLDQKLRALKRLVVGVTHLGDTAHHLAVASLLREGLRPGTDVKIVPLGSGRTWKAALEDGRVDAALGVVPLPEMATVRGKAIRLVDVAGGEDPSLAEFLMGTLVVRQEYAWRNPETVGKVVRAMYQAVRWAQANPPEKVAEVLRQFLGRMDATEVLEGVKAATEVLVDR